MGKFSQMDVSKSDLDDRNDRSLLDPQRVWLSRGNHHATSSDSNSALAGQLQHQRVRSRSPVIAVARVNTKDEGCQIDFTESDAESSMVQSSAREPTDKVTDKMSMAQSLVTVINIHNAQA